MREETFISQDDTQGFSVRKYAFDFLNRIREALFYPVFSHSIRKDPLPLEDAVAKPIIQTEGVAGKRRLMPGRAFWGKLIRALFIRLLAAPLLILFCIALVVWTAIKPAPGMAQLSPDVLGLYYEPVVFRSADGTLLKGWFIPSLDVDEIVAEGDKALRKKRPAVILCHDYGANREQLLPLSASLHHNGYDVLLFDFRATGESGGKRRSFGLYERDDVLAAIGYLKKRSTIDPQRIALIGEGLGAAAALSAATVDSGIHSLILADLDSSLYTAAERKLSGSDLIKHLCASAFVWGCETYFHLGERQLSMEYLASQLQQHQSMLLVYRPKNPYLTQSASEIVKSSNAPAQLLSVPSTKACLLTDTQSVSPLLLDFLQRSIP